MNIVFLDEASLGQVPNLDNLRQLGQYTGYANTPPAAIAERIHAAEVVITNKVKLGAAELQAASRLRLICVAATGTDNIDHDYCASRGIAVRNAVDYSTDSVAQFTLTLTLALLHRVCSLDTFVKGGDYARHDQFAYWANDFWEIRGRRWGIIGLGKIGRRTAALATAFGAEVVYYSTTGAHDDPHYRRLELDDLLESCDIISIHAPLNPRTRDLLAYDELCRMQPHALLINVGRGGIVAEADLAKALDAGQLGGAAVDVYSREPLPADHPYLRVKEPARLLLTPHAAWASREARTELVRQIHTHIEALRDDLLS